MRKPSGLEDEKELIQGCIQGKREAQNAVFRLYGPRMLGICARYCRNMEDAKDAMQDGFVKIFNQISDFNQQSKLSTWMSRIMINTAIDHFRADVRYQFNEQDSFSGNDDAQEDEDDYQTIPAQKILEAINRLSDGYRIVFNLYAIEGFTHKEIAAQLGISEGTSKSQYARARKQLKEWLTQEGIRE